MEIKIFDTLNNLNQSFTQWLKEILAEKETVTISLSGGSTPKALFDYWSHNHQTDVDWSRIKFFWGDERCVPPTDEQSNYKMTKAHLFNHVRVPESHIFRIKGENNPDDEAKRYAALLETEVEMTDGIPSFDLLMLGMGDDGHTASIFPHQMALWNSNEVCVVATHPESGQQRVSITGGVINAAQRVAFLVTGAGKAEKVREIISQPAASAEKYPAARVQPQSGELKWFLDGEAAGQLERI